MTGGPPISVFALQRTRGLTSVVTDVVVAPDLDGALDLAARTATLATAIVDRSTARR